MPSFSLIQESKDEAHGDAAKVAGNVELPVEPVEALGAGNVEMAGDVKDCVDKLIHKQFV